MVRLNRMLVMILIKYDANDDENDKRLWPSPFWGVESQDTHGVVRFKTKAEEGFCCCGDFLQVLPGVKKVLDRF